MGSGAESYRRKGFLIHEEMRKYCTIYEESVSHKRLKLHPIPLNLLKYEDFLSVYNRLILTWGWPEVLCMARIVQILKR